MFNCENNFKIVDNVLYSFNNTPYPALPFEGELHVDLARVLQDPEQADIIYSAFVQHIKPHLSEKKEQEAFYKALLAVCQLFGTSSFLLNNPYTWP